MKRRTFLQCGLTAALASPLLAAVRNSELDQAAEVLRKATDSGQVHAASLYVRHQGTTFARSFGASKSSDDIFLLASISKPISIAGVMTLYDRNEFQLDDPVRKFIPGFTGDGREKITVRQLMTHVSGLPDQVPDNEKLRRNHSELSEFIEHAIRTPLLFEPGTQYSYSSMAILLATEVARRITGRDILEFVNGSVFRPLEMQHSALGLGKFKLEDTMRSQVTNANPESGAGDPTAKDWDWNSSYWRALGAPWGGAHGSAADVAKFLDEFLHPAGKLLKPQTARLMIANHNPEGLTPRGLGFGVGTQAGSPGCSERTFGHSGATGTLAWADPATDTICVVLTTLPSRAANPHPYKLVSTHVANAVSENRRESE